MKILNDHAKKQHSSDPYEFFIIDDFLDPETYSLMRKEFYSVINDIPEWQKEFGIAYLTNEVLDKPIYIYGGTSTIDSYTDVRNKFADKVTFKKFLDSLLDKGFVDNIIQPIILKKTKIWDPTEKLNLFNKLFYNNLTFSIKFSRSTPGSGIALHPDNYPKVISMLLYFGWSDGKKREGQGTQIYKKDSNFPNPIHHCYFSHKNFKLHKDVTPLENRLMGFVAGQNSWHGVDPNSCTEKADVTRDLLQINLIKHTNYKGMAKFIANCKIKIKKTLKSN
jgi:hypothetical protein